MTRVWMTFCGVLLAGLASAGDSVSRSPVEARLDALEVINVTAQKAPRTETVASDEELDEILAAAELAEHSN